MERYYFDYAATTPLLDEVKDEMKRIISDVYGNPSSIHYHGRIAKNEVEDSRKKVASLINASLGEVFFTSGATETNNTVMYKAVEDLSIKCFISSPTEHHCITHMLDQLKDTHGCKVILLDVDRHGNIKLEQLRSILAEAEEPCMVSLMHANNEIGTIHPIQEIGELCAEYNALFHCDAAQSYGKINIDTQKSKIHFLAASAHKIYGPKGVGLMYINDDIKINPLLIGGAQERNMRSGTEDIVGISGFACASSLAEKEMDDRHHTILNLRQQLLDGLSEISSEISINGNTQSNFLPNIISLNLPKNPKTDLLVFNLDIAGISASAGSACSSGVEQASHVLSSINPDGEGNVLRVSISHFTTAAEIEYLLNTLNSFFS